MKISSFFSPFYLLFFILILIFDCQVLQAQKTTDEKNYPTNHKIGEVVLKKEKVIIDASEKISEKVFEIEVDNSGNYLLSVLSLPAFKNNIKNKISVLIDSEKEATGVLASKNNSWELTFLSDSKENSKKSLFLTKGTHLIRFSSDTPDAPFIDNIYLTQNKTALLNTESAVKYLAEQKGKKLPADYKQQKESGKVKRQLSNPQANYTHEMDVDYNYTFFHPSFYLYAGQTYTFETQNSNCDPVMYIYYTDNPSLSYWVNDDFNGLESKVTLTVNYTGSYSMLVKSYNSDYSGVSDIYQNGSLWFSGCPVGGKLVPTYGSKAGNLNFFTSHLRGGSGYQQANTQIFAQNAWIGRILAHNDNYNGTGDFQWGLASRIKGTFENNTTNGVGYILVSSANLNVPTGTCDLYMNCENFTPSLEHKQLWYTNLKEDDAILTAPETPNSTPNDKRYNCFAWAGGLTNKFLTLDEDFDDWEGVYDIDKIDNYLGNLPPRYAGAWTYTRGGITDENAVIDIWGTSFDYGIQHASVRKPGNDHPHGYGWESKNGIHPRFMHPRNAFIGGSFGQILVSYMDSGIRSTKIAGNAPYYLSLEKSIELGYSVIEKTIFSEEENKHTNKLIDNIPVEEKREFEILYAKWKKFFEEKEITYLNNPNIRKEQPAYNNMLNWLKISGKRSYPLIFNKFLNGEEWDRFIIMDLTFSEYESHWLEIKKEHNDPKFWYDKKGAYLVRSPENNCRKYLQRILKFLPTEDSISEITKIYPNPTSATTYIEFYLKEKLPVTLYIVNPQGERTDRVLTDVVFEKGLHKVLINLDVNIYSSGFYIARLQTPTFSKTLKIVIQP